MGCWEATITVNIGPHCKLKPDVNNFNYLQSIPCIADHVVSHQGRSTVQSESRQTYHPTQLSHPLVLCTYIPNNRPQTAYRTRTAFACWAIRDFAISRLTLYFTDHFLYLHNGHGPMQSVTSCMNIILLGMLVEWEF